MKNKESSVSEKQRQLKREFKQSVFIIIVVLCVMVATTIAWYTQNTTVGTEGVPIWSNYQSRFELQVGSAATSLDKQTIECVLKNFLYDSEDDEKKDYIGPGAKGKLEIHILPHYDDVDSVKVKLSMYALDHNGEPITKDVKKQLIQGHLLLFQEKDQDNIGLYTDLISLDDNQEAELTIVLDRNDNNETINTTKTLYWVWPMEFDDYITWGPGRLFQTQDDMEKMIDYINTAEGEGNTKTNYQKYFYNQYDSDLSELKNYTVVPLDEMGSEKKKFREYYNNADQYIGETIGSLAIDLSIWE